MSALGEDPAREMCPAEKKNIKVFMIFDLDNMCNVCNNRKFL